MEITNVTELPVDKQKTELESSADIKRASKDESDSEVEIEETKIIKRKKTKTIRAVKSKAAEYVPEEKTDNISPFEVPTQKQFPLNTSTIISQATGLRETIQMDKWVPQSKATIDIIPHIALTQEHTVVQENEKEKVEKPFSVVVANKTTDTVLALEVTEHGIQSFPEQFEDEFKPVPFTATKDILPNITPLVEQVTPADSSSIFVEEQFNTNKATFSLLPQEAKNISQTEISIKEEEFPPFELIMQKSLSLQSSGVYSEATHIGQVAQINDDVEKLTAHVDIIPLSAVTEQHTQTEEKEGPHYKSEPLSFLARKTVDTVEAFEVSEQTVQNITGNFENVFHPNISKLSVEIVPNESISVQEINLGDISSILEKQQEVIDTASIELLPQEAKNITEVEVSHKESLIDEFTLPKRVQAVGNFSTNESINVEEILQGVSEKELNVSEKPISVKPKYKIDSKESIIVEEILPEIKPGKHLPEAFVATEIATKNIIPQKSITLLETVVPELEGQYIPGRLPPSQTANVEVKTGQSLIISQANLSEREDIFEKAPSPEKAEALSDIVLSEGIAITLIESQQSQTDIQTEELTKHIANVNILPNMSIVSETTITAESEGNYEQKEAIHKSAESNITCLEVSSKSITAVQESENILLTDKQPTKVLANSSYSPIESITIEEIETGDTPTQFKDYPKMVTDTAHQNIETLEATNVIETQAIESETTHDQQQPEYLNIENTLTRPHQQIEIREMHALESEHTLDNFTKPDSHKGKKVTTHILSAGVTEQVVADYSARKLEQDKNDENKAEFSQSLLNETIISEIIASEATDKVESEDIVTKQAVPILLQQQALNVSEVLTDDKEKQYISEELPNCINASYDVDTQKVASKSIVFPNYTTENLNITVPLKIEAITEQDTLQSVEILEYETAEREMEHLETQPETKQAEIQLSETLPSSHVLQVVSNEKEDKYHPLPKPLQVLASSALATQEVIVTSEIQTVVHADNIEEEEPLTGRAKKYARPYTELIVTETNIVDVEKNLPSDIFPFKKQANIDILPGQAISVTETVTNNKEQNLEISETETSLANINISEQQVALKEEIVSNSLPAVLVERPPEKLFASSYQDISHPVIQMQFTPGEKEGRKESDIKPDSKHVNICFTEKQSVNIIEINAEDKEKELPHDNLPEGVKGESSVSSYVTAMKEEVISEDSVNKFEELMQRTEKAKPDCTLLDSFTTTESIIIETEINLVEVKPEEKIAYPEYQPAESISITSVTSAIKEGNLDQKRQTEESATSSLLPQDVLEIAETIASDAITDFDRISPTRVTAVKSQSEHKSLISTEAIAAELESTLKDVIKPSEQKAEVSIDHKTTAEVSETISNEKEILQNISEIIDTKVASPSLSVQPVAETNVVFVQYSTENVLKEEPLTAQANINQLSLEGIIETEHNVQESEKYFEKSPNDIKQANVEFREDEGIIITQIISTDTESNLNQIRKPILEQAVLDIDVHKLPTSTEVNIQETVDQSNIIFKPIMTVAHSELFPLETAVTSETIPTEAESSETKTEIPETKKALISFNEDQSILIESIFPRENETELVETPINKTYAEHKISDTKCVVSQTETQTEDDLKELCVDKPTENQVQSITIPYDSVVTTEQVIVDTEQELNEGSKAKTVSAAIDIEHSEGLSTTETFADLKEENLKEFDMPRSKKAEMAIDVSHKIVQLNITQTSEISDIYNPTIPETRKALTMETTFDSIIVTENIIDEQEKEFKVQFQPDTSKAEISLEKSKHSTNVSEIHIQEKEGEFESSVVPSQQKATKEVSFITVPETCETFTGESFPENISIVTDLITATLKQTPHEKVIQTQPIIQEKEGKLIESKIPLGQNATFVMEGTEVPSTYEVISAENEDIMEEKRLPYISTAESSLITNIYSEVSDVQINLDTQDLVTVKPTSARASADVDILSNILQSVPVVMENSEEFDEIFRPKSEIARGKIDGLNQITIEETYTETRARDFKQKPNKSETASHTIDATKAIQQSEVIPSENIGDHITERKQLLSIDVKQDTLESVMYTENIIHESEQSFQRSPSIELKKADAVIDKISSLNISEVIPHEMEKPLILEDRKEEFSSSSISPNVPLSQTVILPNEDTAKLISKLPTQETAELTKGKYESLIVLSKNVEEKEIPFEELPTEGKTANISLFPEEHLTTIETVPSEVESTFTEKEVTGYVAEKIISSQEATQIVETTPHHSLSQFKTELQEQSNAIQDHILYKTVNVAETLTSEKELDFRDKKPKLSSAEISLEKASKTVEITEIDSIQTETPLLEEKPKIDTATLTINEHKVIQERDINVFEGIKDIQESKPEKPHKAVPKTDALENLVQTDITVQGNARFINIEPPLPTTANVDVTTNLSLIVTEITTQGDTGEEIKKVSAKETTAEKEIEQRSVVVNEETTPLQGHELFNPEKIKVMELQPRYTDIQHGLIVTEQKSTGNLGFLEYEKPSSRTVQIVMDEISPSLQISEVQLHEVEGKFIYKIIIISHG